MQEELEAYLASDDPVPPQFYAQVIKFLRDNGIDAQAVPGSPVGALAETLEGGTDADVLPFRR